MPLNKFCFFLSLSTGTIIIGVINAIYGFLLMVYEILLVEVAHNHQKAFTKNELEQTALRDIDVIYSENSLYTMQFLFGIYLIYGSTKEKPSFLFANVILHIALTAYSSCFVGFAVLRLLWDEEAQFIPNGSQIINELIKIPVLLYLAFIVYSRHEELVLRMPTMMGPIDRRQITDSDTEDIRLPD